MIERIWTKKFSVKAFPLEFIPTKVIVIARYSQGSPRVANVKYRNTAHDVFVFVISRMTWS